MRIILIKNSLRLMTVYDHLFLLIPRRFLFILMAFMFQAILVLVKGTTLRKCLKNPVGISSYKSFRLDWISPSQCSITLTIFLAFSPISSVKLNYLLMFLRWWNWTFPDSKKCALMATVPSIVPFLTIQRDTHSPVTKLLNCTFLLVIPTWTERASSDNSINTKSINKYH